MVQRWFLAGLLCVLLPWLWCSTGRAEIVYQAFNVPFEQLAGQLQELKAVGITHVLVSPPQKSLERPEWWARYQPVDYRYIEGPLGDEEDLRSLLESGRELGLAIVIDTVLNHSNAQGGSGIKIFTPSLPQFIFQRPVGMIGGMVKGFRVRHQAENST